MRIGMTVWFRAKVVLGTGFSISGLPGLTVPFRPAVSAANQLIAGAWTEVGNTSYPVQGQMYDSGSYGYALTFFHLLQGSTVANWLPTTLQPFSWASGDIIEHNGYYEVQ